MTFGEKLKKIRTDRGLTQDELAASLYVSRTAISKWESDRGYPSIDSLQAIARFFGISVDALLSGDELLTVAQEETQQKGSQLCDLVYGLLDLAVVMLLFLPLFAQKTDVGAQAVSLLTLDGGQIYLKIAYLCAVIGAFLTGTLTLALQGCRASAWRRSKTAISLGWSTLTVLLFVISLQPYAAIFAFVLLAIKAFLRIKQQ